MTLAELGELLGLGAINQSLQNTDIQQIIAGIVRDKLNDAQRFAKQEGGSAQSVASDRNILFIVAASWLAPGTIPGHVFIGGANLDGSGSESIGWFPANEDSLIQISLPNSENPTHLKKESKELFGLFLKGNLRLTGQAFLVNSATYKKVFAALENRRGDYDLLYNNCVRIAREAMLAGGIELTAAITPDGFLSELKTQKYHQFLYENGVVRQ